MNLNKLISQFNEPDTELVISQWPEAKTSYHGVAAYTRETLLTLTKQRNMRFVVLAETGIDNRPKLLNHGRILLLRVFDHKHPSLYPTILFWLHKFSRIKRVTVHSEFGAHTGLSHFLLQLPFLLLIKLTGRQVIYYSHNVIDDFSSFASHVGLPNWHGLIKGLNAILPVYYSLLHLVTDSIIVLDQCVLQILMQFGLGDKLTFVPHWVKSRTTKWTKNQAKKTLGIPPKTKVILAFGFISKYKGSDALASMFQKALGKSTKYQLVFAGGLHPIRNTYADYVNFYRGFQSQVTHSSNMHLTGFVPDQKIGLYFAAADLVVLPYRSLMGGSGTLAYALGYGKPFLLSNKMKRIWSNTDISQALKNTRTKPSVLSFGLNQKGMQKILRAINSERQLRTLTRFSKALAASRNIESNCSALYNQMYDPATNPVTTSKNHAALLPALETTA